MLLTDFHIHSTFSDGKLTIPELVDHFGKRGFDAIAITDHLCESETVIGEAARYLNQTLTPGTFPFYLEIIRSEAERARDQYGMLLLPGFEISRNSISNHRSAHILAVGIETFIPANGDLLSIAKKIRSEGALCMAAHPVNTGVREKQTYHLWNRRDEFKDVFDAWEWTRFRRKLDIVRDEGLPLIANSDLHHPKQMTAWRTLVDSEKHPLAIFEAIRQRKVDFYLYEDFLKESTP